MNKPEAEPERMSLASVNVAAEKRDELKRCLGEAFPEVFAEGSIDFDQLKRALGEWVDPGKERFGLNWPGKAECMKIIQQPSVATLKPVREESVDFDTTENLFIEGENLEVLKLFQKAYFGKIKLIYIDPPYNTGNEFIYPDKYAETLETYLSYTGQLDVEGRKFATNSDAAGRFHSRWLNMMYPRLYLARNLLREDGAIFISIDDHEMDNLRKICNEVFGEENFVASIIWQKKYSTKADSKYFSESHEYVLAYAKQIDAFQVLGLERTDEQESIYKNLDNDPRGPWTSDNLLRTEAREYATYEVVGPTGQRFLPPKGSSWRFNKDKMESLIADNRIWFGNDGDSKPRLKRFRSDVRDRIPPQTFWSFEQVGHTDEGTKELAQLLGGTESPMPSPKPSRLLRRIVEVTTDTEGTVLDFFAGSGTLGQAVMDVNNHDGGHRQFILVQLPEPTERNDFATIAEITKERVRRAAKTIANERDGKLDLNGGGTVDLGFKVLKLDRSNFNVWDGAAVGEGELSKQIEMHVDHLSEKSNAEDVLYELLLKAGFPLTTKVKTTVIAGKQVFSIEDGALLICLEKEITPELIDALAEANPLQVICLDEGFEGNDQLKANAVQTFRARAEAEESEIVFKTV